ncbi:RNA-binding protein PNO1-like [Haliotis rubra]|uniref:RNA-binding protein PNO1-like n=1 Tax=Haliotis rubra TaxID=36100 RepID=UPI001EE509BE|nr:RNA-binding protein PNO1-like [Haliotis rubra]
MAETQTSQTSSMESSQTPQEDSFIPAKRKLRKRKMVESDSKEETVMDTSESAAKRPSFPPISSDKLMGGSTEMRKIPIPQNRYTPLKENWMKIFTPVVEHLHLQIRFNLRSRNVEIKTCKETKDIGALQKAADFVKAFSLGFEVDDALALVRLDDLYLESFSVTDVKPLKGDHLARAIGRLAGKNGKTKFTIENVTKTRIVLADTKVNILGSYQNIQVARRAICNLILGSPPSKVYGQMRSVASRSAERF